MNPNYYYLCLISILVSVFAILLSRNVNNTKLKKAIILTAIFIALISTIVLIIYFLSL